MARLRRILLAAIVIGYLSIDASAELRLGGTEFRVNSYTTAKQANPAVAGSTTAGFVVIWTSDDAGFGAPGFRDRILGQRYATDGASVGTEFQVNSDATGIRYFSSVARAPGGEFIVVWSEGFSQDRDDGDGVRVRRFDSDADPIGTEYQVNSYTTYAQLRPSIAMHPSGAFVVVWESSRSSDYEHSEIRARRFGSDGLPLGADFQISESVAEFEYLVNAYPSVAAGSSGEFLVVWRRRLQTELLDTRTIEGRRFDTQGLPLGSQFRISESETAHADNPAVERDGSAGFVVAWQSVDSTRREENFIDIYTRRYALDATPLGTEFRVNTYTTHAQYRPSVAVGPDGDFVIAWNSRGSSGSDTDKVSIQAQHFDSSALPLGGELQINSYTTDTQRAVAIAYGGPGNALVVWDTDVCGRNSPCPDADIRGRALHVNLPGCGDPVVDALTAGRASGVRTVTVSDALTVLRTVAGLTSCPLCVCDVDASEGITATDALIVLRASVGLEVTLTCPPCR